MAEYKFHSYEREREDEMDAGEEAAVRAVRAAFTRADMTIGLGTWQMVDATIESVLVSGVRTYHAEITVEVNSD